MNEQMMIYYPICMIDTLDDNMRNSVNLSLYLIDSPKIVTFFLKLIKRTTIGPFKVNSMIE